MNANTTKKNLHIPYGRQSIDEEDIAVVTRVLRSDWLTTGPNIPEFEVAVSRFCGTRHGVAVSSGTAALHAAMYAIGIGPGDEVIVPAMTFVATANCVVYQGGVPVFADVLPDTLLINPADIVQKITPRTKAIIVVDYAGHPCEYSVLRQIASEHGIYLVADSCHALGAECLGQKIGALADLTIFSFHPVKHITTAEGGMVVTNDSDLDAKMRIFRNHGIATDHRQRAEEGTWRYEMVDLGYNYRLSDVQCALGVNQLKKLPLWLKQRQEIAAFYDYHFDSTPNVNPLKKGRDIVHAYHLYVVQINFLELRLSRMEFFRRMRRLGIGVNVHYLPIYLHPYYKEKFKNTLGCCPVAEETYGRIVSLPIYPALSVHDKNRVVESIGDVLGV